MEQLKIEPPANPLDAGNFKPQPQRLRSVATVACWMRAETSRCSCKVNPSDAAWGWRCPCNGDKRRSVLKLLLKPEAIETLNLWLHAPQSDWLKRQGIEAGEWCDAVDDLSPLSMDELNRHQLIRERLAEQLDQLADHPDMRWEQLDHVDWRARCCGQGLMPPGAAAQLDQDRLEQRWQNLQQTLFSLGPVHQHQSDTSPLNTSQLMAGEIAVHISTSKLRARTLLQAWLQHLCMQLGDAPCSSAVICRPEGSAKADQFQIAMRWQTMTPDEAMHQIGMLQGSRRRAWSSAGPFRRRAAWREPWRWRKERTPRTGLSQSLARGIQPLGGARSGRTQPLLRRRL